MNRDDIIRMAEELVNSIEEFAEKIAAAEREACARMCEAYMAEGIGREMARTIRARDEE